MLYVTYIFFCWNIGSTAKVAYPAGSVWDETAVLDSKLVFSPEVKRNELYKKVFFSRHL